MYLVFNLNPNFPSHRVHLKKKKKWNYLRILSDHAAKKNVKIYLSVFFVLELEVVF